MQIGLTFQVGEDFGDLLSWRGGGLGWLSVSEAVGATTRPRMRVKPASVSTLAGYGMERFVSCRHFSRSDGAERT